jgi:hypothetical protein
VVWPPNRFAATRVWSSIAVMGRPRLLKSLEPSAVPIAKYFVVVGSVLAVLLLIAGWSLPEPPANFPDRPEIIDRTAIRIRSALKWPEKVVLDTNQPTIPASSIEVAPTEPLVARLSDEMTDHTRLDSLAKLNPDARPIDAHRRPARAKRKPARAFPSIYVARTRNRNEQPILGKGEECCRFEWADGPAISKAASRKGVARPASLMGWHFPEAN